jgi:hypothetical protein
MEWFRCRQFDMSTCSCSQQWCLPNWGIELIYGGTFPLLLLLYLSLTRFLGNEDDDAAKKLQVIVIRVN